jgi:hypothetical protein
MWRIQFSKFTKLFLAMLPSAVLLSLNLNAQPSTNEVFIMGSKVRGLGGTKGEYYEYLAKWSQLPSKAWSPGGNPFPLQLDAEVGHAKSHLMESAHITNNARILDLTLNRLYFGQEMIEAQGKRVEDFTNQWSLRFMFSVEGKAERCVVMLLDGSFTTEKAGREAEKEIKPQEKEGASIPSHPGKPEKAREPAKIVLSNEPNLKISRPDFLVPSVQWNPDSQPFPLDLGIQASCAKDYILSKKASANESTFLKQISMLSILPAEAIEAQKLDLFQNLNHWIVTFEFRQGNEHSYYVHILLDGSILAMTESD